MTLDFRLCYSLYVNLLINLRHNELAGNFLRALIKSSSFSTPTSWAPSCDLIPSPVFFSIAALVLDATSTLVLVLNNQTSRYTNENLQKAIKLTLKLFL